MKQRLFNLIKNHSVFDLVSLGVNTVCPMNHLSTFLYARPSFLEGVARLIDWGNTLQEYNTVSDPKVADYLALSADWRVVGHDLESAMFSSEWEKELNSELIAKAKRSLAEKARIKAELIAEAKRSLAEKARIKAELIAEAKRSLAEKASDTSCGECVN